MQLLELTAVQTVHVFEYRDHLPAVADMRKQRRVHGDDALRRLDAATEHEKPATGQGRTDHQHHAGHLNRGEPREPGRRIGHASMLRT